MGKFAASFRPNSHFGFAIFRIVLSYTCNESHCIPLYSVVLCGVVWCGVVLCCVGMYCYASLLSRKLEKPQKDETHVWK